MKRLIISIAIVLFLIAMVLTLNALLFKFRMSNQINQTDQKTSGSAVRPVKRVFFSYQSNAQVVQIAGDFTGWLKKDMKKQNNNNWYITFDLEPGSYKYNIIENGRMLLDPHGTQKSKNYEGGECSVINIL